MGDGTVNRSGDAYVFGRPPTPDGSKSAEELSKEEDRWVEEFVDALLDAPPPSPGFLAWQASKYASAAGRHVNQIRTLLAQISHAGESQDDQEAGIAEIERHLSVAVKASKLADEAYREAHKNQENEDVEWARERNLHLFRATEKQAKRASEALRHVERLVAAGKGA